MNLVDLTEQLQDLHIGAPTPSFKAASALLIELLRPYRDGIKDDS